uniref:Uncharacterized protein n=1 Tax=Anguilla anguilla TaxID=7936 RepID=A0A0E9R700_ANGAN
MGAQEVFWARCKNYSLVSPQLEAR